MPQPTTLGRYLYFNITIISIVDSKQNYTHIKFHTTIIKGFDSTKFKARSTKKFE